jgi:3'-phosphoadenosine 5'-phosphosulfate sulfotransferase (PAPS reductase)/FAD synthetase
MSAPIPLQIWKATEAPDLRKFGKIVISTSAGKDSMVAMLETHAAAHAAGVADRLVAVHADLGEAEWPGTKELAEAQAARLGIRFEVVTTGTELLDHILQRGMWPDSLRRYCTSDKKRAPIRTLYTRLADDLLAERGYKPRQRLKKGEAPAELLAVMGLRAEESPKRAKRKPLEVNTSASSGRRRVTDWLAVHGWTEERVWARIASSPLSDLIHPAYEFVGRLSCTFCIFAPFDVLVTAGIQRPDLLAKYAAAEAEMGHTFRTDFSLADVVAAIARGEKGKRVNSWRM